MKTRHPTVCLALMVALAACSDAPADDMEQAMGEVDETVEEIASRFEQGARSAMEETRSAVERLEAGYAETTGEAADAWQQTRMEIAEYRGRLENDLARLGSATEEQAAMIRDEITADLAALTERVERASLRAAEGGDAFVEASRAALEAVEADLAHLRAETADLSETARAETEDAIAALDERAGQLRADIEALTAATEEEMAEQRDAIAQRIGELTASVQRELLEVRRDVTT